MDEDIPLPQVGLPTSLRRIHDPGDGWTEDSLFEFIKHTYKWPKFSTIRQVASEPGFGGISLRWCDAIVIPIWPSAGVHLRGFEIKCSRADWQRELSDMDKSKPFREICGEWWIVAPEGVVKKEELPDGWGLAIPARTKLKKVVKPTVNGEDKTGIYRFIPLAKRLYETGFVDGQKQMEEYIAKYPDLYLKTKEHRENQKELSELTMDDFL